MKVIGKVQMIIMGALLIVAILVPLLTQSTYYQGLFLITFIWIILNQGFNILLGYTGYCSLTHGGLFGVGAYVVAIATTNFGVNVWLAPIIAITVMCLLSYFLALIVFRTHVHFFAILTLLISLVFFELFNNLEITGRNIGIAGVPKLFSPAWPRETFYYFALLIMILAIAFAIWLKNTRFGYGLLGIGANEKLAASVGISLFHYKTAAFVMTGLYAGVAGVLYAYFMNYVNPIAFSVNTAISMLIAVVLGGVGTILGPILGSFLVVFLPTWLLAFQQYQLTIFGLLVIFVIRFMPQGFMGIGSYLGSLIKKPNSLNKKA